MSRKSCIQRPCFKVPEVELADAAVRCSLGQRRSDFTMRTGRYWQQAYRNIICGRFWKAQGFPEVGRAVAGCWVPSCVPRCGRIIDRHRSIRCQAQTASGFSHGPGELQSDSEVESRFLTVTTVTGPCDHVEEKFDMWKRSLTIQHIQHHSTSFVF